jgi:hypothetical protein
MDADREEGSLEPMRSQNGTFLYLLLVILLSAGFQPAASAAAETEGERFDNADCLDCHGDEDLEADTERGDGLDLHVDERVLSRSIHGEILCSDCHRGVIDFEDSPHNEGAALELNCSGAGCHDDQVAEYAQSIHGQEYAKGDEEVAACPDCHGRHDILASSDRRSRTNKFNLHKTCAVCHESELILESHPIDQETAVPDFIDSIHGRALLVDGLVVAPSCNDCHGVHDILPHTDPDSRISRATFRAPAARAMSWWRTSSTPASTPRSSNPTTSAVRSATPATLPTRSSRPRPPNSDCTRIECVANATRNS